MPSCVVKWCKNNSTSQKKSTGITFHNLPKDLSRRKGWVEIIRICRNENSWNPSNYTLICSSHFEDSDFYMTKQGLRRLKRSAIPKKTLFNSSKNEKPDAAEQRTSVNTQQVLPVSSYIEFEVDIKREPSIDSQQVLFDSSNVVFNDNSRNNSLICDAHHMEQPTATWPVSPLTDLERQTVFDSPNKQYLINQVKKQNNKLSNNKKKIKLLFQKVRRLETKNKLLVDITKRLRINAFQTLNENIVAADLFNALNRKKGKKIKFSLATKKFGLTLYHHSPKAYIHVRNTFNMCLPHPTTLSKWYASIKGTPGVQSNHSETEITVTPSQPFKYANI